MQESEIYSNLTDIFRDIFDDDSITLGPNTTAKDIKGWDSFNQINIIVATEARFKIRFKTAEIESLQNVGSLVDLIQARQVGSRA